MRNLLSRRLMLAVASVLALAAAGIAVAGPAPSSMSLVSATFSTGAPTNSHTFTCTGANNAQITFTDATYTGTAVSNEPRLNGAITIHVRSVYDGSQGTLTGDVRIDSSATPVNHFHAGLSAVDVGNNVQGWIGGHAGPGAQIVGALAGPFTATGGFGSSTIGATAGSATNPALITSGNCMKPQNPPKTDNGPKHGDDNDQGQNGPKGEDHWH
jgi:hypothetical protein